MNQQVIDMQTKTLEQMKTLQTQALELNERIASSVVAMIPEMPAAAADKLPQPADVIANYFDFVADLQTANREFLRSMMSAWIPTEETAAATAKTSKK